MPKIITAALLLTTIAVYPASACDLLNFLAGTVPAAQTAAAEHPTAGAGAPKQEAAACQTGDCVKEGEQATRLVAAASPRDH